MPRLNWTTEPGLQLAKRELGTTMRLELKLARPSLERLIAELESLFADGIGPELRIELSPAWTLFWKLRDGDSRLILAHPETEAWVGSVILNEAHAAPLLEGLRGLVAKPGSAFEIGDLSQLGSWSGISNFQLSIASV